MKKNLLHGIYSFLAYTLIISISGIVITVCAVGLMGSFEYLTKIGIYGLLMVTLVGIIWYFRKKSKEELNFTLLFSLFGQLTIIFIALLSIHDYKTPNEIIFAEELALIGDRKVDAEMRMAQCEKTLHESGGKNRFVVHDIIETCRHMFIDVARESHLNVIPALATLSRLDEDKFKMAQVKLCLVAESGEVDKAAQMAIGHNLNKTAQILKETGHCRMFLRKRDVAGEF